MEKNTKGRSSRTRISEESDAAKKTRKKKETKGSVVKKVFTVLFILGTIGICTVLFLLYGPYSGFREWLVTTAMTTMTHQYFATWFYDDDVIDYILNNNKVIETNKSSNPDLIDKSLANKTTYENEYERQILERDKDNNDYKIIDIKGKGYSGYLVAVYDPSRIKTVVTKKLGTSGQYLTKMAEDNDALIAVNGGGFDDPNFNSTGGSPLGITICDGKSVTSKSYGGSGGLIGFDKDDRLVLGKMTLAQAQKAGIRDCVTFGPFLIVDGEPAKVLGNGGWGSAPRTVIGQRKDGIVLFLVIDGRTATRPGADMDDLIEVMQRYGAYNAANLDGGTSSVLVVNNTIVNDPIDSSGAHKTRPIATGFILTKDDKDNSDHSLVEDKLN
ncbi:MAG: phosphodiester glycosidase family protein [Clostridia bacterium]|nr:phosphodiester glycosidase family protein [Clostridia bacterium]